MNQSSSQLSRRKFLNATAAVGMPLLVHSGVLGAPNKPGANEQVKIGVIGVSRRGPHLIQHMPKSGKIVAICDCSTKRMDDTLARFGGPQWATYQDYREMFDKEKLDGVVIATMAFQRVLPCIHACQAGIDVYAEKPLTLYPAEGPALITAVRKHKTVFQHGTQSRSLTLNQSIADLVQRGGVGKLKKVLMRCLAGPGLKEYDPLPRQPMIEGMYWDMWCNQAPLFPFNEQLFRQPLRAGYRVGNGNHANWVHALDMLQFALGKDDTGPVEIWPHPDYAVNPSGRPIRSRAADGTPVQFRYADGTLVSYELQDTGPYAGAIFVGEDCKLEVNFNKFVTNPSDFIKDPPTPQRLPDNTVPHLENWIDCIKTRNDPNGTVETGHRSSLLYHLISICRWMGRRLRWDPVNEVFPGDDEANAWLDRERRKGYELPDLA